MEFTASAIVGAIFSGLVAGLVGYFASYTKVKAELRATTEDLKISIKNLRATTSAVESEKARVAQASALTGDCIKAVYGWIVASQSLLHSMCWLCADCKVRKTVRTEIAKLYDDEAHKLLPEIIAQSVLIKLLNPHLYEKTAPHLDALFKLDFSIGEALAEASLAPEEAAQALSDLHGKAGALTWHMANSVGIEIKVSEKT